jgi:hypothetical protein
LLALPFGALACLGPVEANVPMLLGWLAVAFASYWIFCVEGKLALSGREVLILGLFLRACMLPMPPCDDMYRYLWEGKVLGFGFSPYRLPPDSPALAQFRDTGWALINHPKIPALYPPLIEGFFALLAGLAHSALLFKAAFTAFDVGAFLMLRRILRNSKGTLRTHDTPDTARIEAIYFLNPLLILEIAGRGHYDSVPIFFNVVFLWALQARSSGSPLSLAIGAMTKINSLALIPLLFYRMSWKRAALWTVILLAAVAGMIVASGMYPVLNRFTTRFHYNGAVPFLIDSALPFVSKQGRRYAGMALFAAAGLYLFRRLRGEPAATQALGFMGLLLLFSPTLHTWYLLWILPFAALTVSRPWLLLSGTVLITYLVYGRMQVTGIWKEIPWLRLPEFVPPLALWMVLKIKSRRSKPPTA